MLLKWGIDSIRAGKGEGWVYIVSGLIVLIAAVGGVFRYFMRDVIVGLSRWIESDLREKFFRHLLRLPPAFFDQHHTGDLMARATDDIERVRMVLGPALLYAVSTQLTLTFSAIMMFWVDYRLAALLLILAPIVGATMLWTARALHKASMRQQVVYGELTTVVQENVSGLRVIKAYTREDYETTRFNEVCRRYFSRSLSVAKLQALMFPLITFLIGIGIAGILWIGGRQVVDGSITLGDFIAFMGYLSLMTWPMIALGWVVHLYQRGSASFVRLQQVEAVPVQFADNNENTPSPTSAPLIRFESLTFKYRDEGPNVLTGIDLVFPPATMTAIVGQTGSGKSTISRLLMRMYESSDGRISINGIDSRDFPVSSLRKMITVVEQTPFLFSDSIAANIKFSKPEATEAEVTQAAYAACFDEDVVGFPDSYQTIIGERGVTLSGGQQQRLTLARALLSDSSVLILDDALSAVDADTEARILFRIRNAVAGRSVIFITHRLAAAESADFVAVLENGKVAEYGTPATLIEANGIFARMYSHQRLAREIEELQ